YQQIRIINESRRGLELIVKSASDLFQQGNLALFAQGVLTQLVNLFGGAGEGAAFLFANEYDAEFAREEFRVVTATGNYQHLVDRSLDAVEDSEVLRVFQEAEQSPQGVYLGPASGFYFTSREGKQLFVYLANCPEPSPQLV